MFKKKNFFYFLIFIFLIFEFYFYQIIDFGESRRLTQGERKFLSEVYGNKINYSEVKIYSRKFFSPIQPDNFAMSPNGNIYFPKKFYKDDFSKADIYAQAWLVHEVMHIYQYKKENQWMTLKGFLLGLERIFGFNPYKYKIDFSKNIFNYNME